MADQALLQAELDLGKTKILGPVLEMTESSARVRVRANVLGGTKVGLRLFRPSTGVTREIAAHVVWHRPLADGDTDLGLKFAALSPAEERLIGAPCVWNVGARPGVTTVEVRGDFSESVDFAPLAEEIAGHGPVEMDVEHVRRINSIGALHWIDFVASLAGRPLRFVRCSLEFTSHTAMSTGMIGHGAVESVMAPYLCARCGESVTALVAIKPLRDSGSMTPPMLEHDGCGGVLEFDDLPERYFSFLE
jgi:hypothetical protein